MALCALEATLKEDQGWEALNAFPILDYVQAARVNGRANLRENMKESAASTYERVLELQQEDAGDLSERLHSALDLAERVLEPEFKILKNKGVPRYESYINQRLLNWSLRTNSRSSLTLVSEQCWRNIHLLTRELMDFEVRSLMEDEVNSQEGFDSSIADKRIKALLKLKNHVLSLHGASSLTATLNRPCSNWLEYVDDPSRDLALIYLSAFPQSNHHDEYAFIRTIHLTECCMWGVEVSVKGAMDKAFTLDYADGTAMLEEGKRFATTLIPILQSLKSTLGLDQFMCFRDATGDSSAIQSRSYNMVEALTIGFDQIKVDKIGQIPELIDLLNYADPRFVTLHELAEDLAVSGSAEKRAFVDAARGLIRAFRTWYGLHFGLAKQALPADMHGTGGTDGVAYLDTRYRRGIYVETDRSTNPCDFSLRTIAHPMLHSKT